MLLRVKSSTVQTAHYLSTWSIKLFVKRPLLSGGAATCC
jgi:hypothetical protein